MVDPCLGAQTCLVVGDPVGSPCNTATHRQAEQQGIGFKQAGFQRTALSLSHIHHQQSACKPGDHKLLELPQGMSATAPSTRSCLGPSTVNTTSLHHTALPPPIAASTSLSCSTPQSPQLTAAHPTITLLHASSLPHHPHKHNSSSQASPALSQPQTTPAHCNSRPHAHRWRRHPRHARRWWPHVAARGWSLGPRRAHERLARTTHTRPGWWWWVTWPTHWARWWLHHLAHWPTHRPRWHVWGAHAHVCGAHGAWGHHAIHAAHRGTLQGIASMWVGLSLAEKKMIGDSSYQTSVTNTRDHLNCGYLLLA